ncbi:MAG: hypothetical protein HRT42_14635 [Campylobacteraceae bacterium]|nr:hypothetical protein [Campylobacteraceae bacterium]
MRPKIYRYQHNEKRYYAEGYDEANVRLTLENYLQIVPGSLKSGAKPDFNTELKLIWDKRNTTHVLSLTKEQTTSKIQLQTFRKKQHCIYELRLLLKEDKTFLNGHQGNVIANEDNEVIGRGVAAIDCIPFTFIDPNVCEYGTPVIEFKLTSIVYIY